MQTESDPIAAPPRTDARLPTIVLVDPDPYLAFLVRLNVPEARILEARASDEAAEIMAFAPDLVIVPGEVSPNPVPDLLTSKRKAKIVLVVEATRAGGGQLPPGVDGLIVRPFVPADVDTAIRAVLSLPTRRARTIAPASPARVTGLLAASRIGAVAVTAVLEVAAGLVSEANATILALAFVYAAGRWFLRRPSVVTDIADVAIAAALVGSTGGIRSNYLPIALVAVGSVGVLRGPRLGAASGAIIVLGSGASFASDVASGPLLRGAVAWALLIMLLGLSGGAVSRVLRLQEGEAFPLLQEANRVLSSLYGIARALPGGLEIGTVADATLGEIRDTIQSSAAAMLVTDAGTRVVAGSYGISEAGPPWIDEVADVSAARRGPVSIVKRGDLSAEASGALGEHACFLVAPLRREGNEVGVLIASCRDEDRHDANTLLMQRLAEQAAVAVENARLFSQVREISIDEERRRLARELHDGVAQALMHLRYELDFMSRHAARDPGAMPAEFERLRRVADRASADVRSMILGLRSSVAEEGLVGSLRSYLRDLRSLGGPNIVFGARGEGRVPLRIESEVFRITQEAVSNSLRHAAAKTIRVSLEFEEGYICLVVEDDGLGSASQRGRERGGGVGLQAMQERTLAIGGDLQIGPMPQGGWRVTLRCEVEEKS